MRNRNSSLDEPPTTQIPFTPRTPRRLSSARVPTSDQLFADLRMHDPDVLPDATMEPGEITGIGQAPEWTSDGFLPPAVSQRSSARRKAADLLISQMIRIESI